MYYKISTEDFQNVKGDYNIISVIDGNIYIKTDEILIAPFEEVTEVPTKFQIDLDYIKSLKNTELENARKEANQQSIEYNGYKIQTNEDDQTLLSQALTLYSLAGQTPDGFVWITEDNQFMPTTLQDLVNIVSLIGKQINDNYIKCRLLKNKVEEATTLEEISTINYNMEV